MTRIHNRLHGQCGGKRAAPLRERCPYLPPWPIYTLCSRVLCSDSQMIMSLSKEAIYEIKFLPLSFSNGWTRSGIASTNLCVTRCVVRERAGGHIDGDAKLILKELRPNLWREIGADANECETLIASASHYGGSYEYNRRGVVRRRLIATQA